MNFQDPTANPNHAIDPDVVMWDRDPEERGGKPLLVMMHGLGSHEGDLFGLNRFLPDDLVVASLRAPLGYGGGYAWFQSGAQSSTAGTNLLDASVQAVLDWIDGLEVTPTGIGLMGFSQGGCMAPQLIREAPERFDYALQLSGFVADADHPGDAALAAREPRMPVFWAHGDQDQVIGADAVEQTGHWLTEHTAVEAHRYPMAHTVSQPELADLVDFVTAQLQR
ncbi:alpha/beta hydrolase [Homoserinimonas sp. OAct 916]|uniref:alpha/beta hydrolase n=1 Tax=Homoserinimonas sp. OAct 916 TaxID=2211450 RepID=UPI001E3254C1|nr:dienelactone hydrolase family protein [Homoserinimonas sp. OAct 916]